MSFSQACTPSPLQVMKSIEDGYRLPPPVDCPAPLYELMKNCWAYDRARRPSFHQLKAHLEQLLANPHSLRTIANFDPRYPHWRGQGLSEGRPARMEVDIQLHSLSSGPVDFWEEHSILPRQDCSQRPWGQSTLMGELSSPSLAEERKQVHRDGKPREAVLTT